MKVLLLATLLLGATLPAHGDTLEAMAGATPAERQIRWLWKYTPDFVRSCAVSGREYQDPSLRNVIQNLLATAPEASAAARATWGRQLSFVSEKNQGTHFTSEAGETHRVALTGLTANAPILLNADRLDGPPERWVGILVHEWTHHLGLPDDERRLPDRVGAAVASHVAPLWQRGTLADFGHPEIELLLFADPANDRPLRAFVQIFKGAYDSDALPNNRVPICASGESLRGQQVAAPLWRATKVEGDNGLVKLRASARVENTCVNVAGARRQVLTNFTVIADLGYSQTFSPADSWWDLPSTLKPESVAAGNSDGTAEDVDLKRSFRIVSSKSSQPTYRPGDTWQTTLVVEGSDSFAPTSCQGYFTASKWFFSRIVNFPMFDAFAVCRLTALGAKRWQVDLSTTFPTTARSDYFSVAFLALVQGTDYRTALPARPVMVPLVNATEAPCLKAVRWNVSGLPPRDFLGAVPLRHSFTVRAGQKFELSAEFEGSQQVLDEYMDLDLILERDGSQILATRQGPVSKYPDMVLRTRSEKTPKGLRLVFTMTPPPSMSGYPVRGFKFRGLSVKTSDDSWSEFEIPSMLEGMFLMDQFELK